jgi:nicotinamidase-related amidase
VNELYLIGLDAAGCVYCTAKGALKHRDTVSVVKDCILLLAEDKWDILMKKFEHEGINLITSKEF